ncbi:MAG: alpha-D-ribose 1-methylphosphonate 5-triphosphate diphosphatase [Dehalococcoidia bacterium]|nr:alpha-D-ribose 1-methylphosphonate 5-triphosphate diphosphatase [Dehalococcoidia bacterium]
MTRTLAVINARVVLQSETLEHASVLVRDGRIERIDSDAGALSGADTLLDAADQLYLIPGLIDTHNDGLEKEVNPRPRVDLPVSLALRNYEERSLASGVTTSFHAISFANVAREERTVQGAIARCDAVFDWRPRAVIDHQVLHRCDMWDPEGVGSLLESLARFDVPALSLQDHTPGQGQFRDIEAVKERWRLAHADDPTYDAEAEMQARLDAHKGDTTTVPYVIGRVHEARAQRPFLIASHDDDTPEKVDAMVEAGATLAEFPVTLEAGRRARERAMAITVGAPNIVRGGSASGNQDATELVAGGLADIICADYHAPSMLAAVFKLARLEVCLLEQAIAMVTDAPARAFGLEDRGRIEVGRTADLGLVAVDEDEPAVQAVIRGGTVVYQRSSAFASTSAPQPALTS